MIYSIMASLLFISTLVANDLLAQTHHGTAGAEGGGGVDYVNTSKTDQAEITNKLNRVNKNFDWFVSLMNKQWMECRGIKRKDFAKSAPFSNLSELNSYLAFLKVKDEGSTDEMKKLASECSMEKTLLPADDTAKGDTIKCLLDKNNTLPFLKVILSDTHNLPLTAFPGKHFKSRKEFEDALTLYGLLINRNS